MLEPWRTAVLPLHACLRDVWHDHVLFEGDRVSGIIDYGAARVDHVSVDLARMLGSLVEDDRALWDAGLEAYRRVRPLSDAEEGLAVALDRAGTILSVANWLRWLAVEERAYEDPAAARRRMATLVARLERW